MKISGANFIGSTLSIKGSSSFKTFNPVLNQENEWDFFQATKEEVDEAVCKAQTAFFAFSRIDPKKRALFLNEIIHQLELSKALILEVYQLESALPLSRALAEFQRTVQQLSNFSAILTEGKWPSVNYEPADISRIPIKQSLRKTQIGIGPVVVFGASNFPLAYSTIGGDSVAALAAGCPVIVKSHPMHAGTGELVAKAVVNAANITTMPDGVFSNLNAIDFQVGQQLVEHEGVAAVGFTGSIKGGVALMKRAFSRKNPIPVFAEMGSVNPLLVFPKIDSDLSLWASKIAVSITNNSGQFCTKPGLIFCLKSPTSEDFFSTLKQQISCVNSAYMVSPIICSNYNLRIEELKKFEEIELQEGTINVLPNTARPVLARIEGKEFVKHPALQQEVFGPFSLVVFFDSMDDLVNAYSALEGQLTTSFFGVNDNDLAHEKLVFLASQKAGRIIFDEVPTGVEISCAMHHSGAFPASSDIRFTAVGVNSIDRFSRPIVYQNKQ